MSNEDMSFIHNYMFGGCGVFAVALSRVIPGGDIEIISANNIDGWDDEIYFDCTHVAYYIDGQLIDATGMTSYEDISSFLDLDNDYSVYGPYHPEYFCETFLGKDKPLFGSEKEIEVAIEQIKKHINYYDPQFTSQYQLR